MITWKSWKSLNVICALESQPDKDSYARIGSASSKHVDAERGQSDLPMINKDRSVITTMRDKEHDKRTSKISRCPRFVAVSSEVPVQASVRCLRYGETRGLTEEMSYNGCPGTVSQRNAL
jgi:hypothetical protein